MYYNLDKLCFCR